MVAVNEILGYEVISTLGHGARSTIFSVRDAEHRLFALKRVTKESPEDERFLEQVAREHEVASKLAHPVLRKSYRIFRQRALLRTTEIVVLMEHVDGPTLERWRSADLTDLCRIFKQVADGLGAMHAAGYAHADIKPNNIIITAGNRVKIIDFGQSCEIGTIKQRIQGTPDYIAPEQVMRLPITPQTDVFNLGATMYWVFTGRHVPTLIPKGDPGVSFKTDDAVRPPRELDPRIPPALSNLILNCLAAQSSQRPASMKAVADRLDIAIAQIRAAKTHTGKSTTSSRTHRKPVSGRG